MQTNITTLDATEAGTVELKDAIFGLEPRQDILHRMVRYQQLKRMAGTHHTQDRSEVNVTGKKMSNQKGGGTARHGDKSAPQFRGGGKAFGPKPRSHAIGLTKKFRQLALRHALSAKAKAGDLVVLDKAAGGDGKTKASSSSLQSSIGRTRSSLMVPSLSLSSCARRATFRTLMFCRFRASTLSTSCAGASWC